MTTQCSFRRDGEYVECPACGLRFKTAIEAADITSECRTERRTQHVVQVVRSAVADRSTPDQEATMQERLAVCETCERATIHGCRDAWVCPRLDHWATKILYGKCPRFGAN